MRGQRCSWRTVDSKLAEFATVGYECDGLAQVWRRLLEMLHFARGCVREGLGPEGAAAGEGAPLARDGMLLDVRLDGVDVEDFEACNVGGGVEEERLAVTSVLKGFCCISLL